MICFSSFDNLYPSPLGGEVFLFRQYPSLSPTGGEGRVRGRFHSLEGYSSSNVMGQWSEPITCGRMVALLTRPRRSSETKK